MTGNYLVAMEISKKQNYIFKSNKLKENIGASLIIKYVTEDLWEKFIGDGEKIYSGGGGSFFEFKNEEKAKDFIKEISLEIVQNYEGLEFYATKISGEFNKENKEQLEKRLALKKLKRGNSFKRVSFGIEEICKSTSTPAVKLLKEEKKDRTRNKITEKREISQEALMKTLFFNGINKPEKLSKEFEFLKSLDETYKFFFDNKFPLDLNEFGNDKNSYIALVNLDGNRMGDMVDRFLEVENDKNLKLRLEAFSNFIKDSYSEAFKEMLKEVTKGVKDCSIRPLVLAGDDVTYIIEAKYALKSVKIFAEKLQSMNLLTLFPEFKNKFDKLTIGAGVVFVNKKAPFNKAYETAEYLCKNAKKNRRNNENISTIDWHILKGEFDDVEAKRKEMNNKFGDRSKKLFMRPMKIFKDDEVNTDVLQRSLERVLETIEYINENSDIRVGKLRELFGKFDEGKLKIDIFINNFRLRKDIKEINNKFLNVNMERAYINNIFHIHDILELCNDKFYNKVVRK